MLEQLLEFLRNIFESTDFMPRWVCGHWSSFHGWIYIFSSIAIGSAYFTIPILLFTLIRRIKNVPFYYVILLFILFILFCGLTHFLDALVFWVPTYRLNALILALTAVISWITVYYLYKELPKALQYNSPEQLKLIIEFQTKELQLSNQKLKESENSFKALVNKNPDIIVKINNDYRYTFVNESLGNLSTQNIDDFIGKTPAEILPNHPHTETFMNNLRKVFETNLQVQYEVSDLSPKLGLKTFSVQMIPLLNDNSITEEILVITKDITSIRDNETRLNKIIYDLNLLTKNLDHKRNTLQDFAYIVSHNLRSPVSNLISLGKLYNESNDIEFKDKLLQQFILVSERLSQTVEDLSVVVNINQNSSIEHELLFFSDILKKQMDSVSAAISSIHAEIVYDFTSCESINYPRIYLESIFLNLLTNALKYSSPSRKPLIKFETKLDQNGIITLTCEDNGLGINMEKFGHKLFSLYKTFHGNSDARGVGLFITKNQINSLGGTIYAESEPDVGTKFIIIFNQNDLL